MLRSVLLSESVAVSCAACRQQPPPPALSGKPHRMPAFLHSPVFQRPPPHAVACSGPCKMGSAWLLGVRWRRWTLRCTACPCASSLPPLRRLMPAAAPLPAVLFLVVSALHIHVPEASTAAVFTAVALTLLCADRTVGARILAAGILSAGAICATVCGGIMVSEPRCCLVTLVLPALVGHCIQTLPPLPPIPILHPCLPFLLTISGHPGFPCARRRAAHPVLPAPPDCRPFD